MKRLILLLLLPTLSFADRLGSLRSNADVLLTTQAVAGNMSPGATYYINVTSSLQSGATFYVSSGTVNNLYFSSGTANRLFISNTDSPGAFTWPGVSSGLVIEDSSTVKRTTLLFSHNGSYGRKDGNVGFISEGLDASDGSRDLAFGSIGPTVGGLESAFYYTYPTNWANSVPIMGTMTVDGSLTASQNVTAESLRVTSTGTIGGVGICLENGTACPPSSGSGSGIVSPGTFTWTNNYGMSLSTLAVSTISVAGAGLLSATQNGLSGLLVVSTAPTGVTVGHMAVFGSSWTIVDGGVPGTGSGGSGIVSPGTFTWTNLYGASFSTVTVSTLTVTSSFTVTNISTVTFSAAINATGDLYLDGAAGASGQVLTSQGVGNTPIWQTPSGGGGSSSLAVANNTKVYTGPNISSPTAIINADTDTMLVELTGSATAFLSLKSSSVTLQGNQFNGASQLVQLNGSTQLPAVSGALLTNLTGANIATAIPSSVLPSTIAFVTSTQTFSGGNTFNSPSGVAVTFGVAASSVAVSSLTASGQIVGTGVTVNELTASQFVVSDANKKLASSLNGSGLTTLTGANIATQIPSSVLPSTIAFITSTQTFTGYHNFVGSSTFTGSVWVSTSILLSGAIGSNGQVLTSGGPGTVPTWTTPTASASPGGVKGNVQYNDGSAIQGAGGFNVWTSSVVISTGGVGGYETYVATLNVVSSFTIAGISTMTSTAQWDQRAPFTFMGKQGITDQIVMSSGPAVAPKWGPIYGVVRTTSDFTTPATTTLGNIPNLNYNLVANSTYSVTCNLVFQTTATVLGARLSMSLTAGSTIAATIEIPIAADGTAGAFQGWVTMSGDPVVGTAVQALNTNYIGNLDGMIFVGSSGATANAMAGGEVTNGSTVIKAGSMCVYNGVSP